MTVMTAAMKCKAPPVHAFTISRLLAVMMMTIAAFPLVAMAATPASTAALPGLSDIYLAAASADEYSPPRHGRLTQQQIDAFVRSTERARALVAEHRQDAQQRLAQSQRARYGVAARGGDVPWQRPWHQQIVFSACVDHAHLPLNWHRSPEVRAVLREAAIHQNARRLAETQAVKSSGGNWAEHRWVQARLRQLHATHAMMSGAKRDETGSHNLALYLANQARIAAALRD